MSGSTWPEQEAVRAWLRDTGIRCKDSEVRALIKAVTAPRLEVQRRLEALRRYLRQLDEEALDDALDALDAAERAGGEEGWNWCPHCKQLVDADDVFDGSEVRCIGCNRLFVCVVNTNGRWWLDEVLNAK